MSAGSTKNLMEGLSIYKQSQSKKWYMALSLKPEDGGNRKRLSLKTDDENEAKKKALGYYYAYHNDLTETDFIAPQKMKISHIVREVVDNYNRLEAEEGGKNWKQIYGDYRNFLTDTVTELWGHKTIQELKEVELASYYEENVHSATQLNTKNRALRDLFDRAVRLGLTERHHTPKLPELRDLSDINQELKNEFSQYHIDAFNEKFPAFIKAPPKEISRRQRAMLQQYMGFLRETGIRPGEEALNIKISDFHFYNAHEEPLTKEEREALTSVNHDADTTHKTVLPLYVYIKKGKIHGKKGARPRQVVIKNEGVAYINNLLRAIWGWDYGIGALVKEPEGNGKSEKEIRKLRDSYIFRLPEKQGTKIQFEKTFEQLCEFESPFKRGAGARGGKRGGAQLDESQKFSVVDRKADSVTLYSCRHTYITECVLSDIPLTTIAAQCGTSTKMIEERYSHLKTSQKAGQILSRKRRFD